MNFFIRYLEDDLLCLWCSHPYGQHPNGKQCQELDPFSGDICNCDTFEEPEHEDK